MAVYLGLASIWFFILIILTFFKKITIKGNALAVWIVYSLILAFPTSLIYNLFTRGVCGN